MKINLAGAFADAWGLFRRHRDVMIAVAGLFIFLPTLALLLLVPAAPPWPDSTATDAQIQADAQIYAGWIVDNARWFIAATLMTLYGSLVLCVFVLDGACVDLRAALASALGLLPRYGLAALLVLVPASLGLFVLVLPGIYILGRTMLVGPALVAEKPLGATAAIMRSIALTRGNGLALAALSGLGLLAGQILPAPFEALDRALRLAGAANPVVVTMVDAAAAAMASAVALATILLRIIIYRQLAGTLPSKGI